MRFGCESQHVRKQAVWWRSVPSEVPSLVLSVSFEPSSACPVQTPPLTHKIDARWGFEEKRNVSWRLFSGDKATLWMAAAAQWNCSNISPLSGPDHKPALSDAFHCFYCLNHSTCLSPPCKPVGSCGLLLNEFPLTHLWRLWKTLRHCIMIIADTMTECTDHCFLHCWPFGVPGDTSDYSQEWWSFARWDICGRRKAYFWAFASPEWQWALWMRGQEQLRSWQNRIHDDNIRWVRDILVFIYFSFFLTFL